MGLSRRGRVAVVLPNGPEMAVAALRWLLGSCAPFNPAYRASEFDFYLAALHPQALIVQAGWIRQRAPCPGAGHPHYRVIAYTRGRGRSFTLTGEEGHSPCRLGLQRPTMWPLCSIRQAQRHGRKSSH